MTKVCYPGTFDPLTYGHLDVIERASRFAEELHILIADNVNKKPLFSVEERMEMLKIVTKKMKNVTISHTTGLVTDYCLEHGIRFMVRGLRNITDYEREYALFYFNHNLCNKIETLILFPTSRNHVVSSSAIKELLAHNADISRYIPADIVDIVVTKYKKMLAK